MALLTKDALLRASDLVEREVELSTIGGSVKVRSLPAAYSNEASSKALRLVTDSRGGQSATIDTAELEILQVFHALVEPKLNSVEEARLFAQNCGAAFKDVIKVIDEISGVDKDAIEAANARFPVGDSGSNGSSVGNDTPDGGG